MTQKFHTGINPLSFISPQSVNARDLGATAFSDYSAGVMDIINYDVHTGNDIMQCCNYTHQILDKYCASQTLVCYKRSNCCCNICVVLYVCSLLTIFNISNV